MIKLYALNKNLNDLKLNKGEIVMVISVPKYTQYQLTELVKKQITGLSLQSASETYDVDLEILEDILSGKVIYKVKHYEVVSKVTGESLKSLLSDEDIKPVSFRSKHGTDDDEEQKRISTITDFFMEVSYLKRMCGEI